MIAIKKHYINENTSKEEFIKDFVSFVKNPSEDNAKMRGAVRKFGVMPKQYFKEEDFKEEDLKAIAEYMYDNEIEKPEWFQKHWEERGIMVRNSVLLIDFVNLRLAEGIPFKQAVIEAGAVRTTPILLTAGTVVIGAFVILFDPIFQGLAISLMGGTIASTVLTLLVLPLVYYLIERKKYE